MKYEVDPNTLSLGDRVVVRAWWLKPEDQLVVCQILRIYPPEKYSPDWFVIVEPAVGERQARLVRADRIERRENDTL